MNNTKNKGRDLIMNLVDYRKINGLNKFFQVKISKTKEKVKAIISDEYFLE